MFNHGGKGKAAVRAPSDYRSAEHCVENQLCTPVEISGRQSLYGLRKAGQARESPVATARRDMLHGFAAIHRKLFEQ